jgi:hypothetical protein
VPPLQALPLQAAAVLLAAPHSSTPLQAAAPLLPAVAPIPAPMP